MVMLKEERKEYMRKWYIKRKEEDPEYIRNINVKKKRKYTKIVYNYLKDHPCVDCGITDIRVLDADHIDPTMKINTRSNLGKTRGIQVIIDELNKCDIRCANCHRIRHFEENAIYLKELIE